MDLTKPYNSSYIYSFILEWLNREALFIFWMIVLNLTVVKLNVWQLFMSRGAFRTEFLMFVCDFSIIFFMVIFLDVALYFLIRRYALLHKIIKYILLGINLCMFFADVFTLYNYGLPFNEIMLDIIWMTNTREAAEFMQIYFLNPGLWLCFAGVLIVMAVLRSLFMFVFRRKVLTLSVFALCFCMGIYAFSQRNIY